MSEKMATLCLLKIKVFWNKDYDVITSVHNMTIKFLLCDSNYIADVCSCDQCDQSLATLAFLWENL